MALVAYRHLLRSTRIAFQGDLPLLKAARQEARNGFLAQASLRPEDPALGLAIAHAEQVSKILVENIVQGKNQGGDKYREAIDGDVELRIHEKTERGDNDTIKMPNGQKVVLDGKTCAER
ncbi:Mitochondrial zinc maintenance protein, mitochondrial [Lachnellula hyalina]|uniref:Mitochondrial zinc maintenance protein 1, mitochondrial n=1 Tax=Lachnellula hyalina TaxID=1316788 RepID=A0A8H8R8N0_9HELO|nr:Mitochondrial zinc maintenance protein, mitochondrial [Lachnellula hyalina]TVY30634.1 Mitochondrial zinc maintenance protein, mitochondrial [Lachnellula hyalina]